MDESTSKRIAAPYLAFKTFTNFLAGFKQSGLPGRIDRTVMAGQSGATQSALMQTLKFLQLIKEDGTPTDQLSSLVADGESQPSHYASLAKKYYSFVFDSGIDVERATEGQLKEVFEKATGFTGETVRKAMTFFVQLAEKGTIKLSPHLKSGKGTVPSSTSSPSRPRRRRANGGNDDDNGGGTPNPHQEESGVSKTYEIALSLEDPARKVVITAPLDLSDKELRRVHRWMQVTFDIGWEDGE